MPRLFVSCPHPTVLIPHSLQICINTTPVLRLTPLSPSPHTPPFALIDTHARNKIWLQSSRDLTSFYSAEEHGCGAFMFPHTRRHMRTNTYARSHIHARAEGGRQSGSPPDENAAFCLLSRLEAINGERAVLYVGHEGSLHGIRAAHMNTCEP